MLKKLSKQEILSGFLAVIKPGIKLSDFQWDQIYETVIKYPEDAKLILKSTNSALYESHFERLYHMMESDPSEFRKYKCIPQLFSNTGAAYLSISSVTENISDDYAKRPNITMVILVRGNPYYPFMVELKSFVAGMRITSLFPYVGVVSGSPNVPYFAHPLLTGYMSMNGILKQRGYQQLLKMIEEVRRMITLLSDQPDFALGLYTICYEEIKRKDNNAVYGNLERFYSYYEIIQRANNISRRKFGAYTDYPGDFMESIQNVMKNNPENFNNGDN